jgi:hypothetical protein
MPTYKHWLHKWRLQIALCVVWMFWWKEKKAMGRKGFSCSSGGPSNIHPALDLWPLAAGRGLQHQAA